MPVAVRLRTSPGSNQRGTTMAVQALNLQFDYTKYGFRDEEKYVFKSGKGLNEGVVRELSGMKGEPDWMLKRRLQALQIFNKKPVPLSRDGQIC
jgi:Fe-S cluster assembly protein SufB